MKIQFIGVLIAIAAIPTAAIAQSTSNTETRINPETVLQTFNRALFTNDPDFYNTQPNKRILSVILGIGSYPEYQIQRDANLVNILSADLMRQQSQSDHPIRTPDLPNPYETSILLSPTGNINTPTTDNEVIYDAPSSP